MTYREAGRAHLTLQQAREANWQGYMSDRDYARYYRLWLWSAPRLFDYPELTHWYERHGKDSYRRRQIRAERIVAAIMAGK